MGIGYVKIGYLNILKYYKNLCIKEFYSYVIGDFIWEITEKNRGYIL